NYREQLCRTHLHKHMCSKCNASLRNNKRPENHVRGQGSCLVQEARPEEGKMSQLQWTEIQEITRKHVDGEDKWRRIYLVLFPDIDPLAVPGPDLDGFQDVQNRKNHATDNGYH
ncbi:hypothetical protein PspLS_01902, partial [Pyricularia sp. CBS 133598]